MRTDPHHETRLQRAAHLGLPPDHANTLAALVTPEAAQDFINDIPTNFSNDTCWSACQVLERNTAMCIEGAFVAAAALYIQGRPPLLVRQIDRHGEDHVVVPFLHQGLWGAISKTNHIWLRWRDPVYSCIRELMMSYIHEFSTDGKKGLQGYSAPLDLRQIDPAFWVTNKESCLWVDNLLLKRTVHGIFEEYHQPTIRQRDAMERRADLLHEHSEQ